jgi:hypothetical protein
MGGNSSRRERASRRKQFLGPKSKTVQDHYIGQGHSRGRIARRHRCCNNVNPLKLPHSLIRLALNINDEDL